MVKDIKDAKIDSSRETKNIENVNSLEDILLNILPFFYKIKNSIRIFSMCIFRIRKEVNYKKTIKYILLNDNKIPIKLHSIKIMSFRKFNYYLGIYKVEFDMDFLKTCPIQNLLRITIEYGETISSIPIVYNIINWNKCMGHVSRRYKFEKDVDLVCYYRQGRHNSISITVRKKNITDSRIKQIKLFFAWLLSKFMFKSNRVLLFEKESNKYEESASMLYEKLIDNGYNNAYYIINKDSNHVQFIKPKYMKNIIYAHTFKHYLNFFRSVKFIGTESMMHSIELRIANPFVTRKLQAKKFKYVFLQHGVMYMVSLDAKNRGFFRKGAEMPIDAKIVVSSKLEAKHFVDLGGFDYEDLYITGLPFYDRTIKKDTADKIVIMPTWRPWDANTLTSDYENSSYYNFVKNIFYNIPEKYRENVLLLPHPLIKEIFANTDMGKYIPEIISYDKILEETALLITDYSSIAYSAFYRGANVIFVWSELEECMEHYEGHLMLNDENVFGDVVYSYEDLNKLVEKNYLTEQTNGNKERYSKIVEFHDNKNTERLLDFLKRDKLI